MFGPVSERFAGPDLAFKRALGKLGQHDQLIEAIDFAHQQPARLCHPFGDQRVGHHRIACPMIVQVVFAERDRLDGRGARARDEFSESVEPEPTHGASLRERVKWGGRSYGCRMPNALNSPRSAWNLATPNL